MNNKPDQALAKKALNVWRIVATAQWFFSFLFLLGYWWARRMVDLPLWPLYIILLLIIIIGYITIFLMPKLQWERWRYKIYENQVELMYGVIVVRRVIIPMIRVQHVDTKQGPLLRRYGLSTVTISTAATIHEIPGLIDEKANSLRDHIAKLAREADADE